MRGKRQDPSSGANDRRSNADGDADPGEARDGGCRAQRRFPSGVRSPECRQAHGNRAKKSHPTSRWWRHRRPAPPRSRKGRRNRPCLAGAASGNWQPNLTRRVDSGAQCQSTGERECGEFPLPTFPSPSPQGGGGEGGPQGLVSGPPAGNCRGAFFLVFFRAAHWAGARWPPA